MSEPTPMGWFSQRVRTHSAKNLGGLPQLMEKLWSPPYRGEAPMNCQNSQEDARNETRGVVTPSWGGKHEEGGSTPHMPVENVPASTLLPPASLSPRLQRRVTSGQEMKHTGERVDRWAERQNKNNTPHRGGIIEQTA